MLDKTFILAGKALFTIEVSPAFAAAHPDAKPHYTFKVTHKAATAPRTVPSRRPVCAPDRIRNR